MLGLLNRVTCEILKRFRFTPHDSVSGKLSTARRKKLLIERPRARRYPLAVTVDLIDMESEAELHGQLTDLSLFGCHVRTTDSWVTGTKLRLRMVHRGAVFSALGHVANIQKKGGIGVVFSKIEQKDQLILEKWLGEIRDAKERVAADR